MLKLIETLGNIAKALVGGGNGWRTLRLLFILLAATIIALAIIHLPGCSWTVDVDGQRRTFNWTHTLAPWTMTDAPQATTQPAAP